MIRELRRSTEPAAADVDTAKASVSHKPLWK